MTKILPDNLDVISIKYHPSKLALKSYLALPLEESQAALARHMASIDALSPTLRRHIHEIGYTRFREGWRASHFTKPIPLSPRQRRKLAHDRALAQRLGFSVVKITHILPPEPKPITLADLGL